MRTLKKIIKLTLETERVVLEIPKKMRTLAPGFFDALLYAPRL